MLGIGFAQELPGHFVLAFYEAKGTLTEVVGRRDSEVTDPFGIVFLVLPEPDQESVFIIAVIRVEIFNLFPISGIQ